MAQLTTTFDIPDEHADHWAGRGVIVTAVSDEEMALFEALPDACQTLELTLRALRTLLEAQDTDATAPSYLSKTIAQLIEPNQKTLVALAHLINLFDHSVWLPKPLEQKGPLQ